MNLIEKIITGKLLGKYLAGRESRKERIQLKRWLDEDPRHREILESLHNGANLAKEIERFDHFPARDSWKKISNRISAAERTRKLKRWGIAAAIIVSVGIGSFLATKYFFQNEPPQTDIAQQQISPGQPKAFIELADGQKWDLQHIDEQQENSLREEAGIALSGNTIIDSGSDIPMNGGNPYEPITLVTPVGGEYKLILEDGSEVWLNADTRLIFPKRFEPEQRRVELDGEAYFKVAKESDRTFIVSLKEMDIEVLGTEFNISAYNNDHFVKTTLVNGSINVENNLLLPGEQADFNKDLKTFEIKKVDVNQYIAWKNGRFVFVHQSLEEISRVLSRWYDVEFVFSIALLKEIPFSGEFLRYESLNTVFEIFEKTGTDIKFMQDNGKIKITSK